MHMEWILILYNMIPILLIEILSASRILSVH
jgi:hypothetical protein